LSIHEKRQSPLGGGGGGGLVRSSWQVLLQVHEWQWLLNLKIKHYGSSPEEV
jgi:hypothetical protein